VTTKPTTTATVNPIARIPTAFGQGNASGNAYRPGGWRCASRASMMIATVSSTVTIPSAWVRRTAFATRNAYQVRYVGVTDPLAVRGGRRSAHRRARGVNVWRLVMNDLRAA